MPLQQDLLLQYFVFNLLFKVFTGWAHLEFPLPKRKRFKPLYDNLLSEVFSVSGHEPLNYILICVSLSLLLSQKRIVRTYTLYTHTSAHFPLFMYCICSHIFPTPSPSAVPYSCQTAPVHGGVIRVPASKIQQEE